MRLLALLTLFLVPLFLGNRPALAQEEASEESSIERAREHMERGQALYLQARFEEAAAEFEAAYQAQAFSAFLYNAGVALERAGQTQRAIEFFEQYLARDPSATDARAVRERIATLRQGAQQQPQPQPGEPEQQEQPTELPEDFKSLLSVRTNPEGATITVRQGDRVVAQGPAPFAHTLDQGAYNVSVEHPDYQTVNQDVRIEPGKVYVVIVEMSQGQFLGYLRVVSNVPGAQVFIDDREQGARGTTPFEAPTPIGTHRVWVERPGYQVEELEAEVGIGEDVTLRVDLTRVDFGRLRVVGNIAGSRVLVDGQQVGTVPFEGQVSAGPHRVRVESDGMKAYETNVTIRNGQLTPMRVRLRPDVGRGGGIVTAVFAGILLAGGVTTAVIGSELRSSLAAEQDEGRLASDDPRLDHGLILYIVADAAFGLSVVLGGLALFYLIQDPLPPSEGSVQDARDWTFVPMLDPVRRTAGVGFAGRF